MVHETPVNIQEELIQKITDAALHIRYNLTTRVTKTEIRRRCQTCIRNEASKRMFLLCIQNNKPVGFNLSEIKAFLMLRHDILISERQLKRYLKQLNLYRRKNYTDLTIISDFIDQQILGSGSLHGYRWMHLKCLQNGLVVTMNTVRRLLKEKDPEGVELRSRNRLRRRAYHNKGPNYMWHVDSYYDKLKPYGIAINGCIGELTDDGNCEWIVTSWLHPRRPSEIDPATFEIWSDIEFKCRLWLEKRTSLRHNKHRADIVDAARGNNLSAGTEVAGMLRKCRAIKLRMGNSEA
ncbi:unnamed protein product [Phaedon cochleariae]|uniref:Transposase n=1 Tax=Phaedon cochleariae TaxID=80249 RepID=A0A9N9SLD9_PHACE|nr:unnamed protein product [Phaedon cochleariae]